MSNLWLDFEKPINELENKINELIGIIGKEEELKKLRKEVDSVKKKVFSNLSRWQIVQLARHPKRPYTLDYVKRIFDDFMELHGDRTFRDDPAIVAGIGAIEGKTVILVGHEKGRDTKEKIKRNFGMPYPEGYRKALRIFKLAEKFNIPIITMIDTPGAYPGIEAEERGQSEAIARNLKEMATIKVPIIVFVTGEGGSGGALAIGVGDRIYMLEYSTYSVISPEGCASILWRDSKMAPKAAESLKITAKDLLSFGIIDDIVPEPLGGAHRDVSKMAETIKSKILKTIDELQSIPVSELINQRIDKFRKIGKYKEK